MDFDFSSFGNRLRKMDRHLGKWARRKGISCFRVYDADVPAFPFAVDRYEDYLHVAEYRRRSTPEGAGYDPWLAECRKTMVDALGVLPEKLIMKERSRQRGQDQYEKLGKEQLEIIAHEYGLRFWVNLTDYLDTGLFLDHRQTRRQVRTEAFGKDVLNLFAYTGTFSVYAAAGRASSTTTLDMSNTYLDWARRNMELNGLSAGQHRFLQADALQWLSQKATEKYDLIILDPPTFSNSKRMKEVLDVQRDHPFLINACLERLKPGGIIYFSTNFRKFKLDTEALKTGNLQDISASTIPKDFQRRPPHVCWKISGL